MQVLYNVCVPEPQATVQELQSFTTFQYPSYLSVRFIGLTYFSKFYVKFVDLKSFLIPTD